MINLELDEPVSVGRRWPQQSLSKKKKKKRHSRRVRQLHCIGVQRRLASKRRHTETSEINDISGRRVCVSSRACDPSRYSPTEFDMAIACAELRHRTADWSLNGRNVALNVGRRDGGAASWRVTTGERTTMDDRSLRSENICRQYQTHTHTRAKYTIWGKWTTARQPVDDWPIRDLRSTPQCSKISRRSRPPSVFAPRQLHALSLLSRIYEHRVVYFFFFFLFRHKINPFRDYAAPAPFGRYHELRSWLSARVRLQSSVLFTHAARPLRIIRDVEKDFKMNILPKKRWVVHCTCVYYLFVQNVVTVWVGIIIEM